MSRRIATAVLGANRRSNRPSAVARQRRLPLGRRVLMSVMGVQARPSASAATSGNKPERRAEAPHTDGTSHFVSPPNAQSPPTQAPSRMLRSEDRQEFARILNDALNSPPTRRELAAAGHWPDREQLRTMALRATTAIAESAAPEYRQYVRVREELRRLTASTPLSARGADYGDPSPDAMGLADVLAPLLAGTRTTATAAVLVPLLAGTAAVISLLLGFILKMLVPESAVGRIFLTTGWVSGAIAGIVALVAVVELLLTALRTRRDPGTGAFGELRGEVERARDAWQQALLERGILPFLREALADPGAGAEGGIGFLQTTGRMPPLGYSRPNYSEPDDGALDPRPSFTSPDFTSPDFTSPDVGGQEHPSE